MSGQDIPRNLVLDDTHVYWSTMSGTLARAPKAGGEAEVLSKLSHEATELALDDTNLYFASPVGKVIGWIPKAGGDPIVAEQTGALGIAVDDQSIYWSTGTETLKLPKGGDGEARVLEQEQPELGSVIVDAEAIYILTRKGAVVRTLRNGGSSVIRPADGTGRGIGQDVENLYVTLDASVVRVPKAGGAQQLLAQGQQPPGRVTADDKFIYWPAEGFILTMPTADYAIVEQVTQDQGDVGGIATDNHHIYWSASQSGEIRRIRKPFDSTLEWRQPWKIGGS